MIDHKKVREYIENHKEEILSELMSLMEIESVQGEAMEGAPFGKRPAEVLALMERILEKKGLSHKNHANYALTADLNDKETALDVMMHLDVVPAGEGWTVTEPFKPLLKDDRLYGRGSMDDKGPSIAALYALLAIRDLGIPVNKNVHLIYGANEETGSKDMAYYFAHNEHAPYTISPDSSFPVVNVEKGIMTTGFEISVGKMGSEGVRIVSIDAGAAPNMVPAIAKAVIDTSSLADMKEVSDKLDQVVMETGLEIDTEIKDYTIFLTVKGIGAHGSKPHMGKNALTCLIYLLSLLPLAEGGMKDVILKLSKLFPYGVHDGSGLGVNMSDEVSGPLTLSFNKAEFKNGHFLGIYDSRVPVCAAKNNCRQMMNEALEKAGFKVVFGGELPAHHVPKESFLVSTLLDSYTAVTGVKKEPLAIGGCTYVHGIENGVAFGLMEESVDNRIHGADEFIDLAWLYDCILILCEAFVRLLQ